MAIKEQDKVFYEELANGDKVINLPITRANNVEGLGRSANTAYVVGDVVYIDSNLSVALKCTQAGTTSFAELDISGRAVGESVEDGTVVWKVIERSNVLDEGVVLPIELGGTGNDEGRAVSANKLNSKLLVSGTDLNSLKLEKDREFTLYYCDGDVEAKTMLNCPAEFAFTLENIPYNSNGFPIQRITEYSEGNRMWVRSYSSWLQAWQEWLQIQVVISSGDGYIRYANGLQFCFGETSLTANTSTGSGAHKYSGQKAITFPLPFLEKPFVIANVEENAGWANAGARSIGTTSFYLTLGHNDTSYPALPCNYVAIGWWK